MLYIFEYLLLVALGYITITQLVFPIIDGLPVFPAFRKVHDLEDNVSEAREDVVEAQLKNEAKCLRDKAKSITKGK